MNKKLYVLCIAVFFTSLAITVGCGLQGLSLPVCFVLGTGSSLFWMVIAVVFRDRLGIKPSGYESTLNIDFIRKKMEERSLQGA